MTCALLQSRQVLAKLMQGAKTAAARARTRISVSALLQAHKRVLGCTLQVVGHEACIWPSRSPRSSSPLGSLPATATAVRSQQICARAASPALPQRLNTLRLKSHRASCRAPRVPTDRPAYWTATDLDVCTSCASTAFHPRWRRDRRVVISCHECELAEPAIAPRAVCRSRTQRKEMLGTELSACSAV